jgi:hypothetical protein
MVVDVIERDEGYFAPTAWDCKQEGLVLAGGNAKNMRRGAERISVGPWDDVLQRSHCCLVNAQSSSG